MNTSLLLRNTVFRKHPKVKVIAPHSVASHDSNPKPWTSFTLFWKVNFILPTTMLKKYFEGQLK